MEGAMVDEACPDVCSRPERSSLPAFETRQPQPAGSSIAALGRSTGVSSSWQLVGMV